MLGKFSQRSQYSETLFVSSQQQMEKAFKEHNIIDLMPISENSCELEILADQKTTPNRTGNCIIGAFVTAHARIQLHKDIMSLQSRGYEVFYCDTDGIIFIDPNPKLSRPLPLSLSPCPGDYKHELGNNVIIKSFACLARKTYSLSFTKKDQKTNEVSVKSSGLSLSSFLAKKALSISDFKNLLLNWQQTKEMSIEVPQLRRFLNTQSSTVHHKICNHKLSNQLNVQRIVQNTSLKTRPFGFCDRK